MTDLLDPSVEFWDSFIDRHWEKAPTSLVRPFDGATLMSPANLFKAVVATCDAYRSGDLGCANLIIGGSRPVANVGPNMPRASDEDLHGFAARLRSTYGEREFMLFAHSMERFDARTWLAGRKFLSGLFARLGRLPHAIGIDTFISNAKSTPFGPHVDVTNSMTFPILGPKTMRIWDGDGLNGIFPRNTRKVWPEIGDYTQHLEGSRLLEGVPGDMFFWTDSCWHVGEGDGRLCATALVWLDMVPRPYDAWLAPTMRQLGEPQKGSNERGYPFDESLPPSIEAMGEQVQRRVASVQIADVLAAKWLSNVSCQGFRYPIPALERAESLGGAYRLLDREFPIRWGQLGDDRLVVFANGHAIPLVEIDTSVSLIRALNEGKTCQTTSAHGELFDKLERARALQRVSGVSS
jgi:hypothetical protein